MTNLRAFTMYALLLIPAGAFAQAPTLQIGGFIDLYYGWNGNHPFDRQSFFPGAGVVAERSNEFGLDFAAVEIQRDPSPVGFHLIVGGGDELDVLHSGEPAGGRDTFRNIYQASVSYNVPVRRGLRLEAGIYPSHIGFESALARDNWNYTGSWAANFTPYYQTGIKAVYAFSDHWSGELHALNGWQIIHDNNGGKSVGARLAWSTPGASVAVSTWTGPELPGDDSHLRTLFDLVASKKVAPKVDLAFEGYYGHQDLPGGVSQHWTALAGYARYTLNPRWAATVRLERFDDPDGGISGLPQLIKAGTLTLEAHPHEHTVLKLEGRYDRSTQKIFTGDQEGAAKRDQLLFVLGSVITF